MSNTKRFGWYGYGKQAQRFDTLMAQAAKSQAMGFDDEAKRLRKEAEAIGTYGTLPV